MSSNPSICLTRAASQAPCHSLHTWADRTWHRLFSPLAAFLLATVLFTFGALPRAAAQHSTVHDNLSVTSEILDMERKYAVYLPPDYTTSERHYPVLYLLHGAGDDQTGWVQFGEVRHIADKAIAEGKATPMVIIMPDANTGQRGYFNNIDNTWRYEDFFFDELMPHVEDKFRIKGQKRYRAVAGLSMGGGGSFMYALHRPDLFSSAAPLSAYVGPLSLESFRQTMARWGTPVPEVTDEELQDYVNRHNAVELIKTLPAEDIRSVRWFIDSGDEDFLYEGNALAHIHLRKREIPHEFRVRDGGHTWTYWRESLPVVLEFVSQAFHQY
ncbi:MAG: alpha/beta hydrolase-fold protein [Bacteroidota bacterium]|nr:alpha/beta hydrolase-fold protein [Bacteroidota bacterium]